mmetsp:Transcript_13993/g.38236  ORF Transcript_13993/g.38236 Transcript_13993/m.38236 type:complete len:375 (+) Transcript_13993:198-1322(+)
MKRSADIDVDDVSSSSGDEGSPVSKRARPDSGRGLGGGNFSDTSAAVLGNDATAEAQLEAMLAMSGGPSESGLQPPAGFSGVLGKGADPMGGVGKAAQGMLGMQGMPGMPGAKGGQDDFARRFAESLVTERKVETTSMDFSKLSAHVMPQTSITVQKELVEHLMTPEHRRLLTEESGSNVEWAPEEAKVLLSGSAEQIQRAKRLLARVMMHCRWGYAESKVKRLLKPRRVESVLCRLSPMNTLKNVQKTMSPSQPILTIGKDKSNDVVIADALISRQHCILEFDEDRGALYVLDCSTNGTFLNGLRLPSKTVGKVLLSHGDELLFKDPASGEQEFGYIVNITELIVKDDLKLEAPRRLLTAEEMSSLGRQGTTG